MYQKSMPKRDKGGGIFPTAEGARLRTGRQRGGAAFAVPPHSVSRLSLAYNTRETRVWGKDKKRYITFSCIIFEPASIRYSILLADAISRAASAFA